MSEKIARSIGKNSEEIEIIQYGLHQAFFMLINFITIIICGLLWQELIFSLVLFTAIYFIRPYAGGYHADTEIRCYFLSVGVMNLWTTWRTKTYRANYDHAKKEHRCTAQNGNGVTSRSDWTVAERTARTDFISQTLANNRSYASTK